MTEKEATMQVKVFNRQGQLVGPVEVEKIVKTDAEWAKQLTPEQHQIARGKGTERPFCGRLLDNKRHGVYACVCCGLPLFASAGKFNSGTGWPSFFQPVAAENVVTAVDRGHGMDRTEILCARCDCHLGHVFDDGPGADRPAAPASAPESLAFTGRGRTWPASPTPPLSLAHRDEPRPYRARNNRSLTVAAHCSVTPPPAADGRGCRTGRTRPPPTAPATAAGRSGRSAR